MSNTAEHKSVHFLIKEDPTFSMFTASNKTYPLIEWMNKMERFADEHSKKENKELQEERDLYKDSCSNISTNSINLEKKLRAQISRLNNKIADLKKENIMLEKAASRAQDHVEDLLEKSIMKTVTQNDLWSQAEVVLANPDKSLGTKIAYLNSKFILIVRTK